MRIDGIIGGNLPQAAPVAGPQGAKEGDFGGAMKRALENVNELQTEADQVANKLAAGDPVELHQAMIAMQKASIALQFTTQVRNKAIEAYQEIMRMQI
ncbi:MAG: flagellar hook-basal body complex protein FliE [Armatimonadota bacterium]